MMRRRMGKVLGMLGLFGLLIAVPAACALEDNPAGIVILGNMKPDDQCLVKQTGGQAEWVAKGTLDLSLSPEYTAFLVMENLFPTLSATSTLQSSDGRVDTSTVTVKYAEVSLHVNPDIWHDPDAETTNFLASRAQDLGLDLPNLESSKPFSFRADAAVVIPPGDTGAIQVTLVPWNFGQLLRGSYALSNGAPAEIVAEVRVAGNRQDGDLVKTGQWKFPIRLCNNCLVNHEYSLDDARNPLDSTAISGDVIGDAPCFPGTDWLVSNAYCGAKWGGVTCNTNRCLGVNSGVDAPNELICKEEDQAGFSAP